MDPVYGVKISNILQYVALGLGVPAAILAFLGFMGEKHYSSIIEDQMRKADAAAAAEKKKQEAVENERMSVMEREIFELKELIREAPLPLVNSLPDKDKIRQQFQGILRDQNHRNAIQMLKGLISKPGLTAKNKVVLNFQLALSYQYIKQWDESVKYYREILNQIDDLKGTDKLSMLASIYNNLGLIEEKRQTTSGNQMALKYYAKSQATYEKMLSPDGAATAMLNRANILQFTGKVDQALQLNNRVAKTGNSYLKSRALYNLGILHRDIGKDNDAIEFYKESLKIATVNNFSYLIADINLSIGTSYKNVRNFTDAESHLKQALKFYELEGNLEKVGYVYGNLGIVELMQMKLDLSLTYHQKALDACQKVGDQRGIANEISNIGNILALQGNTDESLIMLHEAVRIHEEVDYKYGIATDYKIIGRVYLFNGDKIRGRQYLDKSRDLLLKIGNTQEADAINSFINTQF